MKLLYATKNNSKIYNMRRRLKNMPIELVTLNEIKAKINIVEDGKTPSENTLKKAQAYYNATKIPTIAADSGLYISGLPKDKQPGLYVRRVNGKELTDDEMIEYYSNLLKSIGGQSDAYYLTGLAIVTENGSSIIDIEEDHFILTSTIDTTHNHRGNPLDVLTIDPICKKYYTQMSDKDFENMGYKFEKECLAFIQKNLIDCKYNEIATIIENSRPSPLRKFDQIFMKKESMIIQAKKFYHYLANKNIVFLGDGDGAAIMYGLLLSHELVDKIKNITLLDFDQRILNYHKKLYKNNSLDKYYNLDILNYNILTPVPKELLKKADMFYINPPYSSKNNGNSVIAWITRCIDLCKDKCIGCIVIPCNDKYPWSKQAMINIQNYLIRHGFIIKEFIPNIHNYWLDDAPDLMSSTIIVEKIKKTENEYTDKILPLSLIDNLYGKKVKIPKYIMDNDTLYGKEIF